MARSRAISAALGAAARPVPVRASGLAKGSQVIDRFEQIITQDIGGRGLAVDASDNLVTRCRGNLSRAARDLAGAGRSAAIVTGFYIPAASGPAIETDGPCGAVALAWMLHRLGIGVVLVTDPLGEAGLAAAMDAASIAPAIALEIFPFEHLDPSSVLRGSNELGDSAASLAYVQGFFRSGAGSGLSHLIAIERAGPSAGSSDGAAESNARGPVYNFRGEPITAYTAKAHLLFDFVREHRLPIRTIGIGDGGNEIGMGSIPREVLHANIPRGLGGRIACRVATDWTIASGVSNWGAYALAAAVASLRGRGELVREWTDDRERAVLAALVERGAVDGITRQAGMSVDGFPLEQHLKVWGEIRRAASAGWEQV